jgi:hypothetical protein
MRYLLVLRKIDGLQVRCSDEGWSEDLFLCSDTQPYQLAGGCLCSDTQPYQLAGGGRRNDRRGSWRQSLKNPTSSTLNPSVSNLLPYCFPDLVELLVTNTSLFACKTARTKQLQRIITRKSWAANWFAGALRSGADPRSEEVQHLRHAVDQLVSSLPSKSHLRDTKMRTPRI